MHLGERAYSVLGERDKANAAISDARPALWRANQTNFAVLTNWSKASASKADLQRTRMETCPNLGTPDKLEHLSYRDCGALRLRGNRTMGHPG